MALARIVVVPGAPALLPGLGADIAPGYAGLLKHCDDALAAAVAGQPEVVLAAAADVPRRDLAWRDSSDGARGVGEQYGGLATSNTRTGWLVAQHLLDRVGYPGVRRQLPAPECSASSGTVLVVAADGSATVGPRSPRPDTDGAEFDAALERALSGPALGELALVTDTAAARVGCSTAAAWRALAAVGAGEWEVLSCAVEAPYGVTSFVAHLALRPLA